MNRLWKFIDKTKGTEIEMNDLAFLLYTLKEEREYLLPKTVGVELMITGTFSGTVFDNRGEISEITIAEELPNHAFYLDVKRPVLH